jgi:hypothetical protein
MPAEDKDILSDSAATETVTVQEFLNPIDEIHVPIFN